METWPGTDKDADEEYTEHPYTELYVDRECKTPLIDYSYCGIKRDDHGKVLEVLFDRWDNWSVDDFNWPQ